jgi:hypothetical protein
LSDPELEEERERRAMMAILNVRESMERGDRLSASDIRNLAPEHLENIKLRGDDYMREVIHQADKDRQRYWENEREQER